MDILTSGSTLPSTLGTGGTSTRARASKRVLRFTPKVRQIAALLAPACRAAQDRLQLFGADRPGPSPAFAPALGGRQPGRDAFLRQGPFILRQRAKHD